MNVFQQKVPGNKIRIIFSDQFSETHKHSWGGRVFDASDLESRTKYIEENAEWAKKMQDVNY
jgi:hypothetical protein